MSTILDALRKVEREREPSGDASREGPAVSPEVRRRRPFPVMAIALCAVIGFSAGALLSWWTPSDAPVEVASLPAPPPPPNIDVPRAPVRAQAKAPPAPVADAQTVDVAKAELPKGDARKGDVALPPAAAPAPAAVAAAPTPAPVAPAVPGTAPAPEAPAVVALEKDSALEPSPFGPARGAAREASAPNVAAKKGSEPQPPAAKTLPPDSEPQDLAALVPPGAAEPPAPETALEAPIEPEPEASPEQVFDTGRSPPGAPRVALSFLQWSSDPARRFAFISIDGAPSQRVHEGEVAAGLTVAAITKTGVQFKREGSTFVIRPRH